MAAHMYNPATYQDLLDHDLRYDPQTGHITYAVDYAYGTDTRLICSTHYRIKGRATAVGRIAWMLYYKHDLGPWDQIRFRDKNPYNTRLENLYCQPRDHKAKTIRTGISATVIGADNMRQRDQLKEITPRQQLDQLGNQAAVLANSLQAFAPQSTTFPDDCAAQSLRDILSGNPALWPNPVINTDHIAFSDGSYLHFIPAIEGYTGFKVHKPTLAPR